MMAAGVLRVLGVPDARLSGGARTATFGTLVPQPVSLIPRPGFFTLDAHTS